MKLSALQTPKNRTPFIKTDRLEVVTVEEKGLITQFDVTMDGKKKEFKVRNGEILKAWKEVEKFCKL